MLMDVKDDKTAHAKVGSETLDTWPRYEIRDCDKQIRVGDRVVRMRSECNFHGILRYEHFLWKICRGQDRLRSGTEHLARIELR